MKSKPRPIEILEQREGRFRVASGESRYWVDPNRLRCTCQAGQHGRFCRHLRAVLTYLGAGAGPESPAATTSSEPVRPE